MWLDRRPTREQALALTTMADLDALQKVASELRDSSHGRMVSYSRKVFIPLTQLCRDVCHYCTFATTPSQLEDLYMPIDEVLELCKSPLIIIYLESLINSCDSSESLERDFFSHPLRSNPLKNDRFSYQSR